MAEEVTPRLPESARLWEGHCWLLRRAISGVWQGPEDGGMGENVNHEWAVGRRRPYVYLILPITAFHGGRAGPLTCREDINRENWFALVCFVFA